MSLTYAWVMLPVNPVTSIVLLILCYLERVELIALFFSLCDPDIDNPIASVRVILVWLFISIFI